MHQGKLLALTLLMINDAFDALRPAAVAVDTRAVRSASSLSADRFIQTQQERARPANFTPAPGLSLQDPHPLQVFGPINLQLFELASRIRLCLDGPSAPRRRRCCSASASARSFSNVTARQKVAT